MKYIEYQEHRQHGSFLFPAACYYVNPRAPRYIMQFHWHRECEIIHLVSGAFQLSLNGESRRYEAGDILFVSGGMIHGGEPQDCVYRCIVFNLDLLCSPKRSYTSFIEQLQDGQITVIPHLQPIAPQAEPVVRSIENAYAAKAPGYECIVQGGLFQLLGLIEQQGLYTKNSQDSLENDHLTVLKKTLAYIAEHYQEDLTLTDLARIAGMNPNYFCRFFKNLTGRTPVDYLNYFRIECACELLTTRSITSTQTAALCGFQDPGYFIRCFKKYKHLTPRQYAKQSF